MSALGARLAELRLAAMLLTRLPMGRLDPAPTLGAARWAFPLVGAGVGLIGWSGFAAALALGATPAMAAGASLGAMALATGGLHFDGLADMADGIGGGRTPEDRLRIMRDSRIGSYGALTLILTMALWLSALAAAGPLAGPWGFVAAGALSRAGIVAVQEALPPARPDGLGRLAAGRSRAARAVLAALALAVLVFGGLAGAAMLAAAATAALWTGVLAQRRLGGQTGDVLGATQVLAETAAWFALACALG